MNKENQNGQSTESVEQNISFFKNNIDTYNAQVQNIDSYKIIRSQINKAISGIDYLLDIGNGGVFDYNVNLVSKIVGLDLFLDNLPKNFSCPPNVVMKSGSALDIPEKDNTFDGVIKVMLIHHLIGKDVESSINNVKTSIKEAHRVLKPGGKLIVVESCVPRWFYYFQKIAFPVTSRVIDKIFKHPATLQYPAHLLQKFLKEKFNEITIDKVPLGKWVLIYGLKVPTILTPVSVNIFVARKQSLS